MTRKNDVYQIYVIEIYRLLFSSQLNEFVIEIDRTIASRQYKMFLKAKL